MDFGSRIKKRPSVDKQDIYRKEEEKTANPITETPQTPPGDESESESICRLVPEVGNNFEILNKIGEGAFSTVFRARLKHYPEVEQMFALKVLIPTCHPSRIENELRCLLNIGNQDNVMGVNLCLRHRDNVVIVMPLFPHEKFNDYVPKMTVEEAREYTRNLLIALRRVHHFKVIHRDIKPSNFLYNRETNKFALVDFGLASGKMLIKPEDEKSCDSPSKDPSKPIRSGFAQSRLATPRVPLSPSKKEVPNIMFPPPSSAAPSRRKSMEAASASRALFVKSAPSAYERAAQGLCGCFGRPVICQMCVGRRNQIAPRAGTAGFRSPEVLMKSPDQDTSVDIWSAGVMFLSVLSTRYPFFRAQDDMGYLSQIISLLGTEAMVKAARAFDKHLLMSDNIPAVDLKTACLKLRSTNLSHKGLDDPVNASWAKVSDAPFDLLSRLLDPNPYTRITAEEALKHPWFSESEAPPS